MHVDVNVTKNDDGPSGKLFEFEFAAKYLIPHDPIEKMKSSKGYDDKCG